MGISLSANLELVNQLIDLLVTPKIIYFCAFFAYEGLRYGVTLTHVGMRKGGIARAYGVFYILVCLGNLLLFPIDLKKFLSLDPAAVKEALSFAIPVPPLGLFFIGLAVIIFLFAERMMRYRQKRKSGTLRKVHRVQVAKKFIYWMAALPFALGIQALLGLPQWVYAGIFVVFMYFSPFSSPHELKKTMKVSNEEHPRAKTSSSTENVG